MDLALNNLQRLICHKTKQTTICWNKHTQKKIKTQKKIQVKIEDENDDYDDDEEEEEKEDLAKK